MNHLKHYLNIPFVEGINDCYDLARQYYLENYGLTLTNYARPTHWYLADGFNFFVDKFEAEGFFEPKTSVNRVMRGDALLMCLGRTLVPNHVAIYVGHNRILHNITGGVSRLDSYTDRWRSRVKMVLRHPNSQFGETENALDTFNDVPHYIKMRQSS